MSVFDTTMAKFGRPMLFQQLGQADKATYSVAGQSDVSLTVVLGPEREEVRESERGGLDRVRNRDIVVTTDPDDTDWSGVASLSRRAKFTLASGEVWAVIAIDRTGSMTRAECRRVSTAEITATGLRDPRGT